MDGIYEHSSLGQPSQNRKDCILGEEDRVISKAYLKLVGVESNTS